MLVGEELDVWLVLGEGVSVEELEEVPEGDEDKVGDGEALRRLATLRPRKVMAERVASASPASHSVDS